MTNPFDNPFAVPPSSQEPAPEWPRIDPAPTAVAGPRRLVAKICGWVLMVFGVLVVIAALVDWSVPSMSVGMTVFGASFAVVGYTMIWQKLPWRVAGPLAGVLMIVSLIIVGATADPATTESAATQSAPLP